MPPEMCGALSPNQCGSTTPVCMNGVIDVGETDIDCGGICGAPCAAGRRCNTSNDCNGTCELNICRIGRWRDVPPMPTERGYVAAAGWPDGHIYVFGGTSPARGPLATVEAYDPDLNAWTSLEPMPSARYGGAAVTGSDGLIYVIGGQYDQENNVDGLSLVVEAYDPANDRWIPKPNLNFGRYRVAAVGGMDGKIYVIGGFSRALVAQLDSVESYTPGDMVWTMVPGRLTTARSAHAAGIDATGKIYAIGGCDRDSARLAAFEFHVPGRSGWFTGMNMPAPKADLAAVSLPDGRIVVLGGNGSMPNLASVEIWDATANTWSSAASMRIGRDEHAAAVGRDGRVYAIGGIVSVAGIATAIADVEVFDP